MAEAPSSTENQYINIECQCDSANEEEYLKIIYVAEKILHDKNQQSIVDHVVTSQPKVNHDDINKQHKVDHHCTLTEVSKMFSINVHNIFFCLLK